MTHLLDRALDALGLIRRSEFDERLAEVVIALAVLGSDFEDLKSRVDEFDLTPAREAQA